MFQRFRIIKTVCIFLLIFFLTTILSYYLLPEGFLKNVNSGKDSANDLSLVNTAVSIFARNALVVVLCIVGCFVAIKMSNITFPIGYMGVAMMFVVNGITLGTWSFTMRNTARPEMLQILLHSFDVIHNAGLPEMIGVALVVSSFGRSHLFLVDNGNLIRKKLASLQKDEKISACIGAALIAVSSVIEAFAS